MASFDTTRPATALSAGGISAFINSIVGSIATWNDARITRASLSKLSARELDDIGLCFGDIDNVVRKTR